MNFERVGLLHWDRARAQPGYTLLGSVYGPEVRLVDMSGAEVHAWTLPEPCRLGSYGQLLPGGNLLVPIALQKGPPLRTAKGGRIVELDWDGNVVWEFTDESQHHDLRRLANGNTVYIGWREMAPGDAARVQGGVPGTEQDGRIYEDYFREIAPGGETVWEFATSELDIEAYPISPGSRRSEFGHANTVCPLPDGNLLVNFRNLDTIAILGREERRFVWERRDINWGRGHDPQKLDNGNILFFSNGAHDLNPPMRSAVLELDGRTGDEVWRYEAGIAWTFFSHVMGGVQPQPNGNLLICESVNGRLFEIARRGDRWETVWEYINPRFDSTIVTTELKCNAVFRAYRYASDGPELEGRGL